MSDRRERHLPVIAADWLRIDRRVSPTVEQARAQLGAPSEHPEKGVGSTVELSGGLFGRQRGVVIHAGDGSFDVWVGGGRIRRVPRTSATPVEDAEAPPLGPVAEDARIFEELEVGRNVSIRGSSDPAGQVGQLIEKCRYGGLVQIDGRVLAVSFRRLRPTSP